MRSTYYYVMADKNRNKKALKLGRKSWQCVTSSELFLSSTITLCHIQCTSHDDTYNTSKTCSHLKNALKNRTVRQSCGSTGFNILLRQH